MTAAGAAPEIEVGLAAPEPGPRVLAPFGRRSCAVRGNDPVGPYRIVSVEDAEGPEPLPGQFYMLSAAEGWGGGERQRPYLARAFSVCRAQEGVLEFLIDDIGPGTRRLGKLVAGEQVHVVGPLGIGFTIPEGDPRGNRALLVGGGIGVAPLVALADSLERFETDFEVLLGFRSAPHCEAATLFARKPALATDDGSAGHQGLITELLDRAIDDRDGQVVFACGPPAMLEAVRALCAEGGVPAQLAMEEAMACGYGACFGCVVKTTSGYRRLCVDGPVVSADDLDGTWLGR